MIFDTHNLHNSPTYLYDLELLILKVSPFISSSKDPPIFCLYFPSHHGMINVQKQTGGGEKWTISMMEHSAHF